MADTPSAIGLFAFVRQRSITPYKTDIYCADRVEALRVMLGRLTQDDFDAIS